MSITTRLKSLSGYFRTSVQMDCKDTLAMEYLAPLSGDYLPWTGSSIRPSALVTILNDIVINRRACIVECGGGISTFYIARQLARQGGHLYTIDHDEAWAKMLGELLDAEGLGSVVTVIHAPMESSEYSLQGNKWYAKEPIEKVLTDKSIELLIVDGPLAYKPGLQLARYPAVPYFKSRLASGCTVILDDINRKGERKIARLWASDLGVQFQLRKLDGGIAIATMNASFNI